ncbi:hypothetical protein D3C75_673530 [compost metagenome]
MLNVDGGKHINPGVEQLFHILPAFRVARTGRIAVRQFVHQDQRRVTCQRRVEIKLLNPAPTMVYPLCRQNIQPVQQRGSFLAAVSFYHANQDI